MVVGVVWVCTYMLVSVGGGILGGGVVGGWGVRVCVGGGEGGIFGCVVVMDGGVCV